ncbi:WD40 repeat-like protein [Trametes coccinea BRFM310]|uniref:WD40 repeat-like protein n=1 Tax=Trametes coccinea (strain BRFM310) TaxID=1353009 RepID=A0A1Y2I722_TRAC3|nr:WD40 repeat-like protein [Trametes coccinea BRFM310]
MVLKYKEYAHLKRGLDGGVSAVAFSPDATYIAVVGTFDNTVYLWRVAERKLVETYKGSSPYLSMRWLPGRTDELLCGSRGGCVDHLKLTHGALTVTGFRAHERPVECLAVSSSLLATGAQCEVTVWKDLHGGAYRRLIDLPPPPRSSHNEDSEVLATGIHWTKSRKYSSLLLVSYMFHGIVIYDASTWNSVRYIPTPGLVSVRLSRLSAK